MILIPLLALFTATPQETLQERLHTTVAVLTSPQLQGRKAGTEGGAATREWIKGEFRAIGLKQLSPEYEQPVLEWITRRQIGVNVLGFLGPDPQATETNNCVLIGAHYDGLGVSKSGKIYSGADDNASGVAALLELARSVSSYEAKLQRCAVFAAWDYEEGSLSTVGGLKGSAYYAANPLFPIHQIDLVLTFDLLGGHFFKGAEADLFVFGLESSSSLYSRYRDSDLQKSTLRARPFLTEVLEPVGGLIPRSDYGPFRDAGVPYLFFSTGTPPYYHKVDDTLANLDIEKLAVVTRYLEQYLNPFLYSSAPLSSVWNERGVRSAQLRTGMELLEALLASSQKNGISVSDRETLLSDLRRLRWMQIYRPSDYPVCWMQITFMDILNAIGVLSNSSRWVTDAIALRCLLE